MISIIICSKRCDIKKELSDNIAQTIGNQYELIIIDNSENRYSIFEAYNIGVEKSKGEYLCFIHDDLLFHTNDWGKVINKIFESDFSIGLIGVAGAKLKTKMPSGWWVCPDSEHEVNIIQHFSDKEVEKWEEGNKEELLTEVVAIDGVFMVMRRSSQIFFEKDQKGFHCYDLNISLEHVINGHKVVVTKEILIEHFSCGVINKDWYNSTLYFYKKYKNKLPFISQYHHVDRYKLRNLEFQNGIRFIVGFLEHGFDKRLLNIWLDLFLIFPFNKFHKELFRMLLRRFVKYRVLKLKSIIL